MNEQLVEFLLSDAAEDAIAAELKASESKPLARLARWKDQFGLDESRALADLLDARTRLSGRHSLGAQWFARAAVAKQASSELTATWRARRFPKGERVADLCAGAGVDSVALAKNHEVIAVDSHWVSAAFVRANLKRHCEGSHYVVAGRVPQVAPRVRFCFADPERRVDGRRVVDPQHAAPSLSELLDSECGDEGLGVKLSPMVKTSDLDEEGELEFISVGGELKEVVLWTGALKEACRRVSLPSSGFVLDGEPILVQEIGTVGDILYVPDPALVRSGLLGQVAEEQGLWGLEKDVAYLSGSEIMPHPLLKPYRVLGEFPNRARDIKRFLRERGLGRLTASRRRFAESPDGFLSRLGRIKGDGVAHLHLTHCLGEARVFVTEPPKPDGR